MGDGNRNEGDRIADGAGRQVPDGARVVALPRRESAAPPPHPRTIVERVYTAGSLVLPPDDRATRTAVAMLAVLGLLIVEEIAPDGALRPLRGGMSAVAMEPGRLPWRLSKPAFEGGPGRPDAAQAAEPVPILPFPAPRRHEDAAP